MPALLQTILDHLNYGVAVVLMMLGFFITIQTQHLIKKLIGLGVFQTSVLLLYISAAYVEGGHAPILVEGVTKYSNPLPHVLMLTAIVVGIAVLAVGMALAMRIKNAFGSVVEEEIVTENAALSEASFTAVRTLLKAEAEMPKESPLSHAKVRKKRSLKKRPVRKA